MYDKNWAADYKKKLVSLDEAAKLIKPGLAIPMHYGSVVGTAANAQKFATLCAAQGIQTKLLTPV